MAEEYTNCLYNEHKKYAAWWPNALYEPGDFGVLRGRLFTKIGNIGKDFGIKTEVLPSSPPSVFTYASKDAVDCVFKPNASIGIAGGIEFFRGSMEISFSGENAIFLYADGSVTYSLDNKPVVYAKLKSLFKKGIWEKEYQLIIEVVRAGNTTVYISGGRSAKVSLDAEIPIQSPVALGTISSVNFGAPNIKLGFGSKKNIAFTIESQPGVTPFMTLSHIDQSFLGAPHWNTLERGNESELQDDDLEEVLLFEETQ